LEKRQLFDEWPEAYDRWFATPIGALVKKYESELILDLLKPRHGELILDAGCGTGVFTLDMLSFKTRMIGLDISLPMLRRAKAKAESHAFQIILGDMLNLPSRTSSFDKVVSITALEFIEDGEAAVKELFRATRRGGLVVVGTLNRLSPWAERRKAEAKKKPSIFEKAIFRSPDELASLAPVECRIKTAVHFQDEERPDRAIKIEREGQVKGLETGAFVAACWQKP